MKRKSIQGLMIGALLFCCNIQNAKTNNKYDFPLYPGERLTYTVEYMTLEIASIRFSVIEQIDTLGTTLFHVRAEVTSNPKVPLLSLNDVYESYFDCDFRSYYYYGEGLTRRFAFRVEGVFDYQNRILHAREFRRRGRDEKLHEELTEDLLAKIRDGLSLFYFLRYNLILTPPEIKQNYAAFVGLKKAPVTFELAKKLKRINAIGKDFDALPAEIRFEFEGVGGMKGEVKLNYSTDGLALPLSGRIKAPIGKVKIRLVEYIPGKPVYLHAAKATAAAAEPSDK